ncbi:MAG: O-antigen ligase family protein [Planctomycetes bacterium]|jgi:O-antigen ligase|nr:O-antigen ligase family protein [Planctomycetota bacterium]MCP4838955.1 O-antigen ligase family protein [Planctomycetota bacterium]
MQQQLLKIASGRWNRACGSIHAPALVLACGLAPIGGVGDLISLWLFGIAAFAAIPRLMCSGSFLATRPTLLFYGSFWLFAVASLAWAPATATPDLTSAWTLLVIPAVLPALHRPGLVLWPIAIGVAAQALIQIGGAIGLIESPSERPWRSSPGLYWYPASVGIWSVSGLLISLALARASRSPRTILAATTLCLLAAVGLALTLNRAAWLAGGIGLSLLLGRWMWIACRSPRALTAAAVLVLLPIVVGASAYLGSKTVRYRVHSAAKEVVAVWQPSSDSTSNLRANSFGMRVLWWDAGWDLMWKRPIIGHGAGSVAESLARLESERPSNRGAAVRGFITSNPHCSLITAAVEQGVPGMALLLLTGIAAAGGAWRRGIGVIAMSSLGPTIVVLLLFGTVHALLLEPYTATLVAILIAMSIGPPPKSECQHEDAASSDTMAA